MDGGPCHERQISDTEPLGPVSKLRTLCLERRH